MKPWLRVLIPVAEAAAILCAVYFEPTCCVRGTLHGEAFFDGKPTSWWRHELTRWEVLDFNSSRRGTNSWHLYYRKPTLLDRVNNRLMGTNEQEFDAEGPSLLHGASEARPVLVELQADAPPEIHVLIEIGLRKAKAAP